MKLYFCCILLCILFSIENSYAQIKDPVKTFWRSLCTDNSCNIKVYKIEYDFNHDGLIDIALSESNSWGHGGGDWYFYMNSKKGYFKYGDMGEMFDGDFTFMQDKRNRTVMISYAKTGFEEGMLDYHLLTPKGFVLQKRQTISADAVKIRKALSKGKNGQMKTAEYKCLIVSGDACWK